MLSGSPAWVAGIQALEPSSAASQGVHQQEAGLETESGLEPGTLIRDVGFLSSFNSCIKCRTRC